MVINWERADAAWLRNLLSQPSGQRLLATLRNHIPKVKSVTKESAWIDAVKKQGAEDLYESFLGLTELGENDPRESNDYRDLSKEGD